MKYSGSHECKPAADVAVLGPGWALQVARAAGLGAVSQPVIGGRQVGGQGRRRDQPWISEARCHEGRQNKRHCGCACVPARRGHCSNPVGMYRIC